MRSGGPTRPAVFLDRDGTIIEDVGCVRRPSEVRFFSFAVDSLATLVPQYELFIVTSQPWVSRGVVSLEEVETVNRYIVEVLKAEGIEIRDVYVCPHERAEGCVCKKPKPYFLQLAQKQWGIDLARSFVVGDHPSDVELAANAGARGIYVLTGHGESHRTDIGDAWPVLPSLKEAAEHILRGGAA